MEELAKSVIFTPIVMEQLAELMRQQCGKDVEDYPWVTLSAPGKRRWLKKAEAVVIGLSTMSSEN